MLIDHDGVIIVKYNTEKLSRRLPRAYNINKALVIPFPDPGSYEGLLKAGPCFETQIFGEVF